MKILILHNRYLFQGGEDVNIDAEMRMLADHGHEVKTYIRSNEEISKFSLGRKFQFLCEGFAFSREVYKDIAQLIKDF